MFGVATVPLVETHHIPARRPRLVRDAADVVREARSFEAVEQQERRMLRRRVVPVAVREHAGIVGHVEVARDRLRQRWKATRLRPRVKRLRVAAGKARGVTGGLKAHAVVSAYTSNNGIDEGTG